MMTLSFQLVLKLIANAHILYDDIVIPVGMWAFVINLSTNWNDNVIIQESEHL
jgi:hypothetical protein